MSKGKKRRSKSAGKKRSPAMMVPKFYMGAQKPTIRRSVSRVKSQFAPKYLMNNLANGGAVLGGTMAGNFLSGMLPIKQPLMSGLANTAIGLVIVAIAGRQEKLALVGSSIMANGYQKIAKNLFKNIPYLSGEQLEITPQDVQRAIETGAITQDQGAALLATMSGDLRQYAQDDSALLGRLAEMSGFSSFGASMESKFVTTDSQ